MNNPYPEFTYQWLKFENDCEISNLKEQISILQKEVASQEMSKMLLLAAVDSTYFSKCDYDLGLMLVWSGPGQDVEVYDDTGSFIDGICTAHIDSAYEIANIVRCYIEFHKFEDTKKEPGFPSPSDFLGV